jgi:hypothetical protein
MLLQEFLNSNSSKFPESYTPPAAQIRITNGQLNHKEDLLSLSRSTVGIFEPEYVCWLSKNSARHLILGYSTLELGKVCLCTYSTLFQLPTTIPPHLNWVTSLEVWLGLSMWASNGEVASGVTAIP